jgi:hypothetical protein
MKRSRRSVRGSKRHDLKRAVHDVLESKKGVKLALNHKASAYPDRSSSREQARHPLPSEEDGGDLRWMRRTRPQALRLDEPNHVRRGFKAAAGIQLRRLG